MSVDLCVADETPPLHNGSVVSVLPLLLLHIKLWQVWLGCGAGTRIGGCKFTFINCMLKVYVCLVLIFFCKSVQPALGTAHLSVWVYRRWWRFHSPGRDGRAAAGGPVGLSRLCPLCSHKTGGKTGTQIWWSSPQDSHVHPDCRTHPVRKRMKWD